jgi:hypothetical protein
MIQAKSVKNLHNSNSSIHLVDEVLLLIFFFLERGRADLERILLVPLSQGPQVGVAGQRDK